MTALPNKCYSRCHQATEEEDDRETLGKEIWRGKCVLRRADFRFSWRKMEMAAQDRAGW